MACVISRLDAPWFNLYLLVSATQVLSVAASCLCSHPCLMHAAREAKSVRKNAPVDGCFERRNERIEQMITEMKSEIFAVRALQRHSPMHRPTAGGTNKSEWTVPKKTCVSVTEAFRRRSERPVRVCLYARSGLTTGKTHRGAVAAAPPGSPPPPRGRVQPPRGGGAAVSGRQVALSPRARPGRPPPRPPPPVPGAGGDRRREGWTEGRRDGQKDGRRGGRRGGWRGGRRNGGVGRGTLPREQGGKDRWRDGRRG